MAASIDAQFVPVRAHIREHPAWFHRFQVVWTPTVLVFDPAGTERYRIEGYLPRDEFEAHLTMGRGRVEVMAKRWVEAERLYDEVVRRFPDTLSAAEALYWRGVSRYSPTRDASQLVELAGEFKTRYTGTLWAIKASIWAK